MSDPTPTPSSLWGNITVALAAVWTSVVRTVIPLFVGLVVGWLVTLSPAFGQDETLRTNLTLLASAVAAALWYVIARYLEQFYSWASLLLGSKKSPVGFAKTSYVINNHVVVAPKSLVRHPSPRAASVAKTPTKAPATKKPPVVKSTTAKPKTVAEIKATSLTPAPRVRRRGRAS
jgi:hypothetical protein